MHGRSSEIDNRIGRILVSVEFDESEPSIRLHADFNDVAETLEEGDEIRLGSVGDEVADVDGRVEGGSLAEDRVVLFW